MLPIKSLSNQIIDSLKSHSELLITAPTGSGKSTQVPQILLDSGMISGRILVLQPRRLAARMLAERVAEERFGTVGGEVGFITRDERAVSSRTRILFVTQGVLLRMLISDSELSGNNVVIFDEFHERTLDSDVGLGAIRDLQQNRRSDLKLIIMSATLEVEDLKKYLPECQHLHSEGRLYPVEINYLERRAKEPVWNLAASAVQELLNQKQQGDILIFMPGSYEIIRTSEAVRATHGEPLEVFPLYGNLPAAEQRRVMAPAPRRKIIVATNIAETSLTIPGIRHVIDSGLARINRYDMRHGFNMLMLEPISRASADQRAGRAGREAPGTCQRLWTLAEHQRRPYSIDAEVQRTDLAEVVLLLKYLNFPHIDEFLWFEKPPEKALVSAAELLRELQAIDVHGNLTKLGKQLAQLPLHPRLAKLLLYASDYGCLEEAAIIAAILTERPLFLNTKVAQKQRTGDNTLADAGEAESDLFAQLSLLQRLRNARLDKNLCRQHGVNPSAAAQILRSADHFVDVARRAGLQNKLSSNINPGESLAKDILQAFPDRLARRLDSGSLRCELRNGKRAELARESTVRNAPFLVAGEMREVNQHGGGSKAILSLATAIKREWLEECFPDAWEITDESVWDEKNRQVLQKMRISCMGLIIEEIEDSDVPPATAAEMLAEKIQSRHLPMKGWNEDVENWLERVRWLADIFPERNFVLYNEADLKVIFTGICYGETRYRDVKNKPCLDFVKNALSWDDQQFVEKMAPAQIQLPCGRRLKPFYQVGQQPKARVQIQELYDVEQTPTVAGGRTKILLDIRAPNRRTVQITDDLPRFWQEHYPAIKKEFSKRYTKHEWR